MVVVVASSTATSSSGTISKKTLSLDCDRFNNKVDDVVRVMGPNFISCFIFSCISEIVCGFSWTCRICIQ